MQVQPYLFFDGRCEEAIEFYKKTLGAKVDDDDALQGKPRAAIRMFSPGTENKSCTPASRIGDTQRDGLRRHAQGKPKFQGFSLSFTAKDEAEADKLFGALAEGGQVQMPLTKTFFSPRFGMVADKFGVGWMVIV